MSSINLKSILEQDLDMDFSPESDEDLPMGDVCELSGDEFANGATTINTPMAPAPVGAPVKTNETVGSKKLSREEKQQLLKLVSEFNQYRSALKMADELKRVAENIAYIAEATEKYGLNETDDWFEGVSLERDMKEIKKLAENLRKISNKVYPQVQLAETLYEEIGLKLERYFNL